MTKPGWGCACDGKVVSPLKSKPLVSSYPLLCAQATHISFHAIFEGPTATLTLAGLLKTILPTEECAVIPCTGAALTKHIKQEKEPNKEITLTSLVRLKPCPLLS